MTFSTDWTEGPAYATIAAERQAEADRIAAEQEDLNVTASTQFFNPSIFNGDKFPGGLGTPLDILQMDYWALRSRSNELFHKNLYARGIVRRLVTNIISTGLHLEACPEKSVLGLTDDFIDEWSEEIESRFYLYNSTPEVCDYKKRRNGGAIQAQIKLESIVGGDCLVVSRQSPKYRLPNIQIISGERVQTPLNMILDKNVIDGVHVSDTGEHIGFWVQMDDDALKFEYISARGENTGREQSRLIYGCDKREDGVRGVPLLAIAVQPLAEIDKSRDATQRVYTLKSMVLAAIERGPSNKKQSTIVGKGAERRGAQTVEVVDNLSGQSKRISFAEMLPGANFEYLNPEEKVNFFNNNVQDVNFGAFEASIVMGVSWALEIPPEILLLSFNKNYSASQAAINEFKLYLDKERTSFGACYCDFIYSDWFYSMALLNRIQCGNYVADYDDDDSWELARAWTIADWSGHIKPSTDMLKQMNAFGRGIELGLVTRSRSAREVNGMKYSRIVREQKKENQLWVEANRPLEEFKIEMESLRASIGKDTPSDSAEDSVNDGASSSVGTNVFSMTPEQIKDAKGTADTYGVLVRAGSVTPQVTDEEYFRKVFGMSEMSSEVRDLWRSSGGFRRPITLAKEESQSATGVNKGTIDDAASNGNSASPDKKEGPI